MAQDIETILVHLAEMLEMRGDDVELFMEHGNDVITQDPVRFMDSTEYVILDTDKTTVVFALTKECARKLFNTTWKDMTTREKIQEKFIHPNILIILSEMPISSHISNLQQKEKLLESGHIQVFLKSELMYNPSKHELVPKHEKLTESEAKQVMDKYNIRTKSQLPSILKTDVMARWLGLRPGDIVKITRYNDTSGEYYYYRCCV
jgi:DNA-directed RNA polymerase subunit H (RpoH/RPB5)